MSKRKNNKRYNDDFRKMIVELRIILLSSTITVLLYLFLQ